MQAVDTLFLSIWKTFKYSSVKQTIFENAQAIEGLKQVKILKDCSTCWRYFDTCYWIPLDTIFHERKDQKAKGIREQLLAPNLIMTLLLLAEVLFLMKHFWTFLQTHNLNYGLIIGRFERLFSILEKVGEFFPHHESLERTLKYSKAKELLLFAKESSKLSRLKQVCN